MYLLVSCFLLFLVGMTNSCGTWVHSREFVELSGISSQFQERTTGGLIFNTTFSGTLGTDASYASLRTAFAQATNVWSQIIGNPFTIDVTVSLGSSVGYHGNFTTTWTNVDYATLLSALQTQDGLTAAQNTPWNTFPTTNTAMAALMHWPSGHTWNNLVAVPAALHTALYKTYATHPTITIVIDSTQTALYDYDPSDGTDAAKYDFVTMMVHQLAHALGYWSEVEYINTHAAGSYPVTILDLGRYQASAPTNVASNMREYDSSALQYWWSGRTGNNAALMCSGSTASVATTSVCDASHWRDGTTADTFGLMDPSISLGQQLGISPNDYAALDTMGWRFANPWVPILETYSVDLTPTPKTITLYGWLIQPLNCKARFNADALTDTAINTSPTLKASGWKGYTFNLPTAVSNLLGTTANITVTLYNDANKALSNSLNVQLYVAALTSKGSIVCK